VPTELLESMSFFPQADCPASRQYRRLGVIVSFIGHLGGAFLAYVLFLLAPEPTREIPVYSVTFEGGKSLGGKAQVAKDDKKSPVAPPKAAAEQEEKKVEKKVENPPPPEPENVRPLPPEKKQEPVHEPDTIPIAAPTVVPTPEPRRQPTPEPPKKQPTKVAPPPTVAPAATAAKPAAKETPKDKKPKEDVNKELQKAMQRYLGNSSEAGGTGFGAARLGGNDYGGGVVKPREFFVYLQTIRERVKGNWRWYDSQTVLVVEIELSSEPTGTISGQRIIRSSGNPEFDDSVLRAVRAASPLPPPPANVYQDFRIVRMIFDPRA
jgi:TonB family protein